MAIRLVKAENDVLRGINLVSNALIKKTIKFHKSCKNCIREFYLYRWDEKNNMTLLKKKTTTQWTMCDIFVHLLLTILLTIFIAPLLEEILNFKPQRKVEI